MRYLLMICHDDSFEPPDRLDDETAAWVEEMERRHIRLHGDRLRPAAEATTIRVVTVKCSEQRGRLPRPRIESPGTT